MDAKSAWEKFRSSGTILDYLNYRSIESGLMPYSCALSENDPGGARIEIGSNRNNNKGNGFKR